MAAELGSIAQTKALLDNLTGKSLSEIEEIIEQCEAFFKATLKTSTLSGSKLLKQGVETRAALMALTIASFNTIEDAALKMDMLYEMYTDAKKFLLDPQNRGTWDYIQNGGA